MKGLLVMLLAICLHCAEAQDGVVRKETKMVGRKVDTTQIVRDSAGKILPYATWISLLPKGYILKSTNPADPNSERVLVKMPKEEWEAMMTRLPPPRPSAAFKTGQVFLPFRAKDIRGVSWNLAEAKGKIIVLNFWFINCGPCRREMPELNELANSFAGNGNVQFISIALDKAEELESFLATTPFSYAVIGDGRDIANSYGIRSYPTNVIIGPDGKVAFHTSGWATHTVPWLRKWIYQLLPATP
jgi:thiol-disulfide isomerase/thioredoxin